jgi:hypothetical protein
MTVLAAVLVLGSGNVALQAAPTVTTHPHRAPSSTHTAAPQAADLDPAASIDGLLSKGGPTDWSARKGARLEGYVVQVERESDGDVHVVLAASAKESDSKKWVIAEVPQPWQAKSASLSAKALRGLYGKKVAVTGWLFYDAKEKDADPRGGLWEIHPVTSIETLGK